MWKLQNMFTEWSYRPHLEKLKELLNEKYHHLDIEIELDAQNIKITLLNGRYGFYENDIDEENKRPIEFLKNFGAKVSKKDSNYPYQCYSVIIFEKEKLSEVIEGLEILPTPKAEQDGGKVFAKC